LLIAERDRVLAAHTGFFYIATTLQDRRPPSPEMVKLF
jgi:hypothetical protein